MSDQPSRGVAKLFHPQLLVVLQCVLLGIWLVAPAFGWALLAAGLGVCSIAFSVRSRRIMPLMVAGFGLLTSGIAVDASWKVRRVETAWPEMREAILSSAGDVLSEMLDSGVEVVRALADSAVTTEFGSPTAVFAALEASIGEGGPERGVSVFDTSGSAIAWAGRHRVAPAFGADGVSARITQFYVLLEAQRQAGSENCSVEQAILRRYRVRLGSQSKSDCQYRDA